MKSSNIDKKLITGDDWNNYFKERYGSQNVRWETAVNSIDEIIDTPSLVARMQPEQMAELDNKSGWNVGPLKMEGKKEFHLNKVVDFQ